MEPIRHIRQQWHEPRPADRAPEPTLFDTEPTYARQLTDEILEYGRKLGCWAMGMPGHADSYLRLVLLVHYLDTRTSRARFAVATVDDTQGGVFDVWDYADRAEAEHAAAEARDRLGAHHRIADATIAPTPIPEGLR